VPPSSTSFLDPFGGRKRPTPKSKNHETAAGHTEPSQVEGRKHFRESSQKYFHRRTPTKNKGGIFGPGIIQGKRLPEFEKIAFTLPKGSHLGPGF